MRYRCIAIKYTSLSYWSVEYNSMKRILQQIDENFMLHATKIPELTNNMSVIYLNNISYVDSSLSCDTFNIIHIRNGFNVTNHELTLSINHFKKRNLDYCIWVNKENYTGKLQAYIAELSLARKNEEIGMSLDLTKYKPIESDKHQNITKVDSTQNLRDYSTVIAANWNPPDNNIMTYYELTSKQYLDEGNGVILLIYYEDAIPKATVELFASDKKTIGIYGLATLEDARGKGIGSALMTMALNKAKELNYQQAVLQASSDGIGIYKKLGFEVQTEYYEYV